MPWYFNFCAPHLPNDSTINFHRFVQTGCLVGFLALYVIIHIYYKLCGPDPQEEKEIRSKSKYVSISRCRVRFGFPERKRIRIKFRK